MSLKRNSIFNAKMIFIVSIFYFIKIDIPLGDVFKVTKEKTAIIIPSGIGV